MEGILNFFTNKPSPIKFITFGPVHLLILFMALIISIFIFRRIGENRGIELFIGCILIFQQIILYSWYFISNYNSIKEGLPLYHCRIAIIFLGLGLIFNNKNLTKLGSYLGIFGSIGALLFPGLDPFSFPHITQFSYFIGHLFLLWGSIYLLFVKKIGMTKIDLKNIFLFTNLYHVIVFVLNHKISSNYAYLRQPPFKINYTFNPYFYGFIVMMIFNIILVLEYLFINKKDLMQDKLIITTL